jgi:glycosyltransferase involved in cell wall biosynthesis
MRPKLSVCITTYNRAALLDQTLKTVAAQTRTPDEVVVSDDCSPDDTARVAGAWKAAFPRFLYRRNERNLNMPGNLNAAIEASSGEYIANLHDGDAYDPTILEKWEAALDRCPSAGFVFCGIAGWPIRRVSRDGIILHDVAPVTRGREFFERHLLHKLTSIVWGTVMARRSAYDALLPFDSEFGFVSDVDMWMRMCRDYDVAYVREPLIHLNHDVTRERRPGEFNWNHLDACRRMQEANIGRMYADDPVRLAREHRIHRRVIQVYWTRRLLGRIRWRDWDGLRKGLALARGLDPPLRWIGARLG